MRTPGQRLAIEQLTDVAAESSGVIELGPVSNPSATGSITATISLDCRNITKSKNGLRLKARETFTITIGTRFPLAPPSVEVLHTRWAGYPHVQWLRHLCLYAAPRIEWQPADGMLGYLDRLIIWVEHAAAGALDADAQALHPPVAYGLVAAEHEMYVPADLGSLAPSETHDTRLEPVSAPAKPVILTALCVEGPRGRIDVQSWISIDDFEQLFLDDEFVDGHGLAHFGALTLLTDREDHFEYPRIAHTILTSLANRGISRVDFFLSLARISSINQLIDARTGRRDSRRPLVTVVGTPSRSDPRSTGRMQHLVAWELAPDGRDIFDDLRFIASKDETLAAAARAAWDRMPAWERTPISWIPVLEDRPEVTVRRDHATPMKWLEGKRVLVLGAGALGAPIAEHVLRAGAGEMRIVDNGTVSPGILVRQPYAHADIGLSKARCLSERLAALGLAGRVDGVQDDAVNLIHSGTWADVDLVIDATADVAVRSTLEAMWIATRDHAAPVLGVLVGHDARRGIATIAATGSSGCSVDILRRLALAAHQEHAPQLKDFADDFYPREPRTNFFQPEPGCSEPTFIGSSADLGLMAAALLEIGVAALGSAPPKSMTAVGIRSRSGASHLRGSLPTTETLTWGQDWIALDATTSTEVRIAPAASNEMAAATRRNARLCDPDTETGGMLLGARDPACGVTWIDRATGPTPDSEMSAQRFDHGVVGTQQAVDHHRKASAKLTTFLGLWHTHPGGLASPSPTDADSMARLVAKAPGSPRRALMVIVGGLGPVWEQWLDKGTPPDLYARWSRMGTSSSTTGSSGPAAQHGGRVFTPSGRATGNGGRQRRHWLRWTRR